MIRLIFCSLALMVALGAESSRSLGLGNRRQPQVGGGPAIPSKGYVVEEIRDGLYWVTDGAYNTMFLVTSEGVIALDHCSVNNCSLVTSSILYFHRNTTGSALICSKY